MLLGLINLIIRLEVDLSKIGNQSTKHKIALRDWALVFTVTTITTVYQQMRVFDICRLQTSIPVRLIMNST